MRRRSNRSSKAAEETTEVVSPRKSKRNARRRKQSSSDSDDEPISTIIDKKADKLDKDNQKQDGSDVSEEQVWKVAPTPQSNTEGEIQKLKICLKRPPPSPEKTKRISKKSSSHHEDEQTDESSRRSSRRGRSNAEEDTHAEDEKQDDVDDKGKLQDKSSSQTEKLIESDCCIDEKSENTQSDDNISDNVQIDPQTVQSDNINTLTGKQSEDSEVQQEECVHEVQEEVSPAPVDNQTPVTTIEVMEEIITPEETNQSEPEAKSAITSDISHESASHITPPIPMQSEQIQVLETEEEPAKAQESMDEKKKESDAPQEMVVDEGVSDIPHEMLVDKNGIADGTEEEKFVPDNAIENQVKDLEEEDKSDSLNVTNDEVIKMDDEEDIVSSPLRKCVYPKGTLAKNVQKNEETTKLEIDVPMRVASPERVCEYPTSMLAKVVKKDVVKPKLQPPRLALLKLPKLTTERKRKWGSSANMKDKLPELKLVTSNLIAEIYPTYKLLDEDEVKMDIPAVISSPSPAKVMAREKRKISIEMPKDTQPQPETNVAATKPPENKTSKENGTGKNDILDHADRDDMDKANQASIIALNRKISIVEDTAAKLKPPPSPAKNPVSAVLYLSNLVRPFTLKQLKELLERTGKIVDGGFWTDRIKSKCYAQYENAEDAEATRNALHGIHWPIGNGKKLMIEFSTPEDMELAKNPPSIPPLISANNSARAPEPSEKENKEPSRRIGGGDDDHPRDHLHRDQQRDRTKEEDHRERRDRRDSGGGGGDGVDGQQRRHVREWDVGKGEEMRLSRTHSSDKDRHSMQQSHSRSRRTPSPRDYDRRKPYPKVEEPPPQKLMDDLFLKTKATPCIYWQALTPEEIALKQQQRLERMAEHQRRLQQTTNVGGLGSGGGYPPQMRGGYSGAYGGGRRRY